MSSKQIIISVCGAVFGELEDIGSNTFETKVHRSYEDALECCRENVAIFFTTHFVGADIQRELILFKKAYDEALVVEAPFYHRSKTSESDYCAEVRFLNSVE